MPKPLRFTEEDVAQRKAHWAQRLPQLVQAAELFPYWQFRAVGDGRDPPECAALSGRIERWDSMFWQRHSPATCEQRECRCTIRAYRQRDIDRLGHPGSR